MPYLNVDFDYFQHPKTKKLVSILGNGADVLPIRLWAYCGKYFCKDGRMSGYTDVEIENILGWWGESGKLIEALTQIKLVERIGENDYVCHNWSDHQGHIYALKVRNRKNIESRWRKMKTGLPKRYQVNTTGTKSIIPAVYQDRKGKERKGEVRNSSVFEEEKGVVRGKGFVPPTLLDLQVEFKNRDVSLEKEAEKFYNYYESVGWLIGKKPMKNWKATVSNWLLRQKESEDQNGKTARTNTQSDTRETPKYAHLSKTIASVL